MQLILPLNGLDREFQFQTRIQIQNNLSTEFVFSMGRFWSSSSSPLLLRRQWRLLAPGGERDLPDPDDVVGVAGEEGLPVGRPCEGNALRRLSLTHSGQDFGL